MQVAPAVALWPHQVLVHPLQLLALEERLCARRDRSARGGAERPSGAEQAEQRSAPRTVYPFTLSSSRWRSVMAMGMAEVKALLKVKVLWICVV